jgi:hypothetical protein
LAIPSRNLFRKGFPLMSKLLSAMILGAFAMAHVPVLAQAATPAAPAATKPAASAASAAAKPADAKKTEAKKAEAKKDEKKKEKKGGC